MKHLEHMRPVRSGCASGAGLVHRARATGKLARMAIAAAMCVCALACSAAPGMADSSAQFWVQSSMLSLEEAADRVQGAYGGRVVAAQPVRAGGHEGFRIRVLLDDGRVITVFVDADSRAMRPMG